MRRWLSGLLICVFAAAACQEAPADAIVVREAWARPAVLPGGTIAVFCEIENRSDAAVRLIGASVDFASRAVVHEQNVRNGVVRMRELDEGLVVAGRSVKMLHPGGAHIMILEPLRDIAVGEQFSLALQFDEEASITTLVRVVDGDARAHSEALGSGHEH